MCSRRGRREYQERLQQGRRQGLSVSEVEQLLNQLTEEGVLRRDFGDDGESRYGLTESGECIARISKERPS